MRQARSRIWKAHWRRSGISSSSGEICGGRPPTTCGGNLGVVANATVGLTRMAPRGPSRDDFVGILMRSVTSLHHLLDDATSLARLQAGRAAPLRRAPLDITPIVQQLFLGIRPLAQQRRLFLLRGTGGIRSRRPCRQDPPHRAELDTECIKATTEDGVTVSWGERSESTYLKCSCCASRIPGPGFRRVAARRLPKPSTSTPAPRRVVEAAKQAEGKAEAPASAAAAGPEIFGTTAQRTGRGHRPVDRQATLRHAGRCRRGAVGRKFGNHLPDQISSTIFRYEAEAGGP